MEPQTLQGHHDKQLKLQNIILMASGNGVGFGTVSLEPLVASARVLYHSRAVQRVLPALTH